MKNIFITSIFLFLTAISFAQTEKNAVLENLEKNTSPSPATGVIATLRSASRLFSAKDDLTAVIFVIPSGSAVEVLGTDSTYLFVKYEDTEGYIFNRNVTLSNVSPEISNTGIITVPEVQQQVVQQPAAQSQQQNINTTASRFTLLENKYGTSVAALIYAGKIWKEMTTEMVQDSWGLASKINRSISTNNVREEWIFTNTWLLFDNDRLIDWGPVNR